MILAAPKCSLDYGGEFSYAFLIFWSLVAGLGLLITACGDMIQGILSISRVVLFLKEPLRNPMSSARNKHEPLKLPAR